MKISEDTAAWMRAALEGKKIQWRNRNSCPDNWFYADDFDKDAVFLTQPDVYEVRIKPDVIVVNGIEVPAPERVRPRLRTTYYVPSLVSQEYVIQYEWCEVDRDDMHLSREVVHLEKANAVAHSKAMLSHKPG